MDPAPPPQEIGEEKEDGTLQVVYYRTGDEAGELEFKDRKSGNGLPDSLASKPREFQGKYLQCWRLRLRNMCVW